jgi:hypothetical protein
MALAAWKADSASEKFTFHVCSLAALSVVEKYFHENISVEIGARLPGRAIGMGDASNRFKRLNSL